MAPAQFASRTPVPPWTMPGMAVLVRRLGGYSLGGGCFGTLGSELSAASLVLRIIDSTLHPKTQSMQKYPPPPPELHLRVGGWSGGWSGTPLCDIPSGCCFLYGALDSPPFPSSRAVSGRCVLSAAAAGVPAGVVSALADPSSWRTGGRAGCCRGCFTVFAAQSPPHLGCPQHASPRFRVREAPLHHPSACCPPPNAPAPPPPLVLSC